MVGGARTYYGLSQYARRKVRKSATRLYDAGQRFEKVASEELTDRDGFVYVISNPAWPRHAKIGRAYDPESRVRGYQTGCPNRSYELRHAVYFRDAHKAEAEMHARLEPFRASGEWFEIEVAHAINAINTLWEVL